MEREAAAQSEKHLLQTQLIDFYLQSVVFGVQVIDHFLQAEDRYAETNKRGVRKCTKVGRKVVMRKKARQHAPAAPLL